MKYLGLGALAIASLAMMLMLVRRATAPAPAAARLAPGAEPSLLAAEGSAAPGPGAAGERLTRGVNELITSRPDHAARVVRRWMKGG